MTDDLGRPLLTKPRSIDLVRLSLITLIIFVDFLGMTFMANVIPVLVEHSAPGRLPGSELYDPGFAYSMIAFIHALGLTLSPPAFGVLSDKFGRRPMLLLSVGGSAVAYAFMGMAASFESFCGWRLALGLVGGGRPVALAYVTDCVQDQGRDFKCWMLRVVV
jgi:DHA1 family tetracycline resistance protein-like MFS transporter